MLSSASFSSALVDRIRDQRIKNENELKEKKDRIYAKQTAAWEKTALEWVEKPLCDNQKADVSFAAIKDLGDLHDEDTVSINNKEAWFLRWCEENKLIYSKQHDYYRIRATFRD